MTDLRKTFFSFILWLLYLIITDTHIMTWIVSIDLVAIRICISQFACINDLQHSIHFDTSYLFTTIPSQLFFRKISYDTHGPYSIWIKYLLINSNKLNIFSVYVRWKIIYSIQKKLNQLTERRKLSSVREYSVFFSTKEGEGDFDVYKWCIVSCVLWFSF